jgi:hypothetical protein
VRLAEQDGPPHFKDATAWLMPMDGQPEGTPPTAVIADPQGAVFAVRKYTPPKG